MSDLHQEPVEKRDDVDRQGRYFETLFDYAPAPFLVTDRYATIRLSNRGVCALLGRDTHSLEGKPLATLLPREERTEFRNCLARLSATEGVTNWNLTLQRRNNPDVRVSAAVHVVPTGRTEAGDLMWIFRTQVAPEEK
jgi:PAS domain S-box-containing protein